MESEGSSDVDRQAVLSNEEEFDAAETSEDNEEQQGSLHIAVDLTHNIHGNRSSNDVCIDVKTGGEPENPDPAPNDDAHDDEISSEAPTDGALNDEISTELPDDGAQDDEVPDEQTQQQVPFRWLSNPSNISNNHLRCRRRWSIPVVPPHLREVDEMSYTPRLVSIGPIHHNRESLWAMEGEKRRFLGSLLDEKNKQYSRALRILKSTMKNIEAKVRRSYSMTFHEMNSDDFVDMLLIDGCFIVLLFCLNHKWSKEGVDVADRIFSTRYMLPMIGRDLLMIENQLPLFVLEKIFKVTKATKLIPDEISFKEVALEFFKGFHIGAEDMVIKKHNSEGHHKHLLDLFQSLYLPSNSSYPSAAQQRRRNRKPPADRPSVQGKNWVPSATALDLSGVRFRAKGGNPLDIQFRRGKLRIPSISIDESSIIILKNLLAYEQSCRGIKPLFTSLVLFFSSMLSVPDDIKLLREASIILHQPGDDQMLIEVLKLLSMQLECDMTDCAMKEQVVDIRAFCGSNSAKIWSSIRRFLAQNAVRLFLLYLSLVLTFSADNFRMRL